MRKGLLLLVCICLFTQIFAQKEKGISTYLMAGYNRTWDKVFKLGGTSGVGAGVQAFWNNKTMFKPSAELTVDGYIPIDKGSSGYAIFNLLVGGSFHPLKQLYVSALAGPVMGNGQTAFGLKPAVGFYFSPKQKITARLSYTSIFNVGYQGSNEGVASLSFGFRLF